MTKLTELEALLAAYHAACKGTEATHIVHQLREINRTRELLTGEAIVALPKLIAVARASAVALDHWTNDKPGMLVAMIDLEDELAALEEP